MFEDIRFTRLDLNQLLLLVEETTCRLSSSPPKHWTHARGPSRGHPQPRHCLDVPPHLQPLQVSPSRAEPGQGLVCEGSAPPCYARAWPRAIVGQHKEQTTQSTESALLTTYPEQPDHDDGLYKKKEMVRFHSATETARTITGSKQRRPDSAPPTCRYKPSKQAM